MARILDGCIEDSFEKNVCRSGNREIGVVLIGSCSCDQAISIGTSFRGRGDRESRAARPRRAQVAKRKRVTRRRGALAPPRVADKKTVAVSRQERRKSLSAGARARRQEPCQRVQLLVGRRRIDCAARGGQRDRRRRLRAARARSSRGGSSRSRSSSGGLSRLHLVISDAGPPGGAAARSRRRSRRPEAWLDAPRRVEAGSGARITLHDNADVGALDRLRVLPRGRNDRDPLQRRHARLDRQRHRRATCCSAPPTSA